LAELADRGLEITTERWGMTALKTLLTKWDPGVCKTSVHQLGWTDAGHTAFVLGAARVIGSGDVVPVGDLVLHVAAEIRKQGSCEEWRKRIGELCIGKALESDPSLLLRLALEQCEGNTAAAAIYEIIGQPITKNELGWLLDIREASGDTDPRLTSRASAAIRGIFGR
jgi:hypothetical protein